MAFDIHRCLMKQAADDSPLQAFGLLLCSAAKIRATEEFSAEGTAFTLLREGDTHVSEAPENVTGFDSLPPCWFTQCIYAVCHMHTA